MMAIDDRAGAAATEHEGRVAIEDVASWVLRVGVIVSVTILLVGLVISFAHGGMSKQVMETQTFDLNLARLRHGVLTFQGFAWLELGILALVVTPILRVFTAMVLFAVEERDRLYAGVTFLVLVMTVASLLFIR